MAAELDETTNHSSGYSGCVAFGDVDGCLENIRKVNDQVLKLIDALGKHGAGRRAVLKALAQKQGIDDEETLELLYSGKTKLKQVPRDIRKNESMF